MCGIHSCLQCGVGHEQHSQKQDGAAVDGHHAAQDRVLLAAGLDVSASRNQSDHIAKDLSQELNGRVSGGWGKLLPPFAGLRALRDRINRE